MSRHLRWTLAITRRLVRPVTWRGIHPEEMLLALSARFWILLRQIGIGRPYSVTSLLQLHRREREKTLPDQYGRDWRLLLRNTEPMIPGHIATSLTPFYRSAALPSGSFVRVCTITQTVRDFLHKSMGSEKANDSTPPMSARGYRAIQPLEVPAAGFVDNVGELSAGVQRRHRRLEQKTFPRLGPDADPERAVRIAQRPDVIETRRRQLARAKNECPDEPGPRSGTARPGPPLDIGQITDAVLQQLDRRLVSARERMGRI